MARLIEPQQSNTFTVVSSEGLILAMHELSKLCVYWFILSFPRTNNVERVTEHLGVVVKAFELTACQLVQDFVGQLVESRQSSHPKISNYYTIFFGNYVLGRSFS